MTTNRTPVAKNPLFLALSDGETLQIFGSKPIARGYIEALSATEYKKVEVQWDPDKTYPGIEIDEMPDPDLLKYMDQMVDSALALVGAKQVRFDQLQVDDLFDSTSKSCYAGKFQKVDDGHAITAPKSINSVTISYEPDTMVIYLPNASINIWNNQQS